MPDERRELHKNAQRATHLLSTCLLYHSRAEDARGVGKKGAGDGTGGKEGSNHEGKISPKRKICRGQRNRACDFQVHDIDIV